MEFKSTEIEDYQSGEIKISYAIRNATTLTPGYYDSLLKLRMTVYIGEGDPLNVMATIPVNLMNSLTIEELVEIETKSMARKMAMHIYKKLGIANIYKKHIKAHKAIREGG